MKKKTFAFFPVEIGVAHISRSLVVAEELQKRGHNVLFYLPKRKWPVFGSSSVVFRDIPSFLERDNLMNVSNLVDKHFLTPYIQEEVDELKKHNVDCVIVDFRLSALVAAKALSIPIVNISSSDGLPYECYFPNPCLNPILYNCAFPVVNKIIARMKRQITLSLLENLKYYGKVKSASEFFTEMQYIIPEHADYLPMKNTRLHLSYVGPLAWRGFGQEKLKTKSNKDRKVVYVSFGGTGFDPKKLIDLSSRLVGGGYEVIVSSSTIADPDDFPKSPHLTVYPFLDGRVASELADVVICHGGYGTMTDAVVAGKPIIAIPFNPDQLFHVFRFEELGLCEPTLSFSYSYVTEFLKMNWKYFQDIGAGVSVDTVIQRLEKVRENYDVYESKAQKYLYMFEETDGAVRAADSIENVEKPMP